MGAVGERLIVVGGGILGALHAFFGRRNGFEVVHLEREAAARGASVRNFGLVWVSGRAAGHELALAQQARDLWPVVAAAVPAIGFRTQGSLTVALNEAEWQVLEAAAGLPDAAEREFSLLSAAEVRSVNPAVAGEVAGALWCRRDATVEPRVAAAAVVAALSEDPAYTWLPGRAVVEAHDGGVTDDRGERHDGDLVVACPGAGHAGVFAPWLSEGVRRVRLQMMQTEPFTTAELTTSIADVDSLRYYPAFAALDQSGLGPQPSAAAAARAQLLCVHRIGGGLTIGDTHEYDEPFGFDVDEAAYEHLLAKATAILGHRLPRIRRRWAGVYSQATGDELYLRREIADRVTLISGLGGRGMTCSPAIAAATFGDDSAGGADLADAAATGAKP